MAYLEVAELVLAEDARSEMSAVATGLAVLAGIAASDAICARNLARCTAEMTTERLENYFVGRLAMAGSCKARSPGSSTSRISPTTA
ncbi:MAG: hypothetical protein ACKOW5_08670 [Actinomycetales bacterium]